MKREIQYIILLLLLLPIMGQAQYRVRGSEHALSLSLDGAAALPMLLEATDHARLGATGGLSVNYEYHYRRLFVGVGVGADYVLSRFASDSICRDVHFSGAEVDAGLKPSVTHYYYINYREQQQRLYLSLPIEIGMKFAGYMYASVGATLRMGIPAVSAIRSQAQTYSVSEFTTLQEPIRLDHDEPEYYIYSLHDSEQRSTSEMRISVAPKVEIGAQLPIGKRVDCRVGAFVQYTLPLTTPTITSHELLAGVRATFVFRFAAPKHCMCWEH